MCRDSNIKCLDTSVTPLHGLKKPPVMHLQAHIQPKCKSNTSYVLLHYSRAKVYDNISSYTHMPSSLRSKLLFCHNFHWYAGKISQITYGRGTGPILLEYVRCSAFEKSLLDCDHNGLGLSTCGHWEDAGVVCQGEMFCINMHH